jgi:5'-nucleotidase
VPTTGAAGADPAVAALVQRYADAARPAAERVVGHLAGPARTAARNSESPVADLIADAQLAASKDAAKGGADLSFINSGGVRTDLVPRADGSVTYGQIFALEPFGNTLVVKTFTGAQLRALLEQQFSEGPDGRAILRDSILIPSANFLYSYDLSKPEGLRIVRMTLDGEPIDPARKYRVTVNNFLASGGDSYSVLTQGTDAVDAGLDLDALEAWLATNPAIPSTPRLTDVTPR